MPPSRRTAAVLTLAAALAGGGSLAAQRLKPEQEALIRPTGKPQSCIPIRQIRESRVRDDSTIDFYVGGRTVYRSALPQPCPELGFEQRFAYETSLTELCSTDIITVLHETGLRRGASCGLGEFQPIAGAPR